MGTDTRPSATSPTNSQPPSTPYSNGDSPDTLLSILNRLIENPDTAQTPCLETSQYFSPSKQHEAITCSEFHRLFQDTVYYYQSQGFSSGSLLALADINTPQSLARYFAGFAVGATMVSINLLALADESTSAKRLLHMLNSPELDPNRPAGVDALVLGEDPMFDAMRKLPKIQKLKNIPGVAPLLCWTLSQSLEAKAPWAQKILQPLAKTTKDQVKFQTFLTGLRREMIICSPPMSLPKNPHPVTIPPYDSSAPADILYTSGTSGNPKGVLLTHGNLDETIAHVSKGISHLMDNGTVVMMGLPFFHIFGKAVMLTALKRFEEEAKSGGSVRIILLPSLAKAVTNLDGVLKTIETYQVTFLPSVPVFLEKLVAYLTLHPHKQKMIQSLKTIISGGAALRQETYDQLKLMRPDIQVLEGYGSTEAGINLLNTMGTHGWVGHPLPGNEAKVVGSDPQQPRVGELWVKGPGVCPQYVKGTTQDQQLSIPDGDGWFHTGDIVSYDPIHGYKIQGRERYFIKIDNEKRAPGELEEALMEAAPDLLEAFVVAHQAGTIHECPIAWVVSPTPSWTEESLKKAMFQLAQQQMITRWKIPHHILVLHNDYLPSWLDVSFKRDACYKKIRQHFTTAQEHSVPGTSQKLVTLKTGAKGAKDSETLIADVGYLHQWTYEVFQPDA